MKEELKVGLVQINNSFSGQNYFPLSAGLLQAHAQRHLGDRVSFLPTIYTRPKVDEAVGKLLTADVVGFSVYVWNFKISLAIAEKLKAFKPNVLIVFGGHHVPCQKTEDFLRVNQCIDIACHNDGEKIFSAILQNPNSDWQKIPSISYLDKNGRYIETPKVPRDKNLDDLPSPYLNGIFDQLMTDSPNEHWVGLWETNRGCPFSCAWCDWAESRMSKWSTERVYQEIEWFAQKNVDFVTCTDANFGILPRDVEIAKLLAETKQKYGYPQAVSIQSTKNVQERSFQIQKILAEAGMNRVVVMSVQSLHPPTLKAVGRSNISLKAYEESQRRFNELGIPTVTDLILAQPEETYESWVRGIDTLLNSGQHNRIQFGNLSILPKAEISDPEYQKKYGIQTVESAMVNNHGFLPPLNEISETQELVIATNSMSADDWVRARVFSWMTGLLHFDKLLQIPFVILRQTGLSYGELIEFFSEGKFNDFCENGNFPILTEIRQFFIDKARDIQNGGYEFCHAPDWLNIFWPADEYVFIKLCIEAKLAQFYSESMRALSALARARGIEIDLRVLSDAIRLNQNLIKLPNCPTDIPVAAAFNIWEHYRSVIVNRLVPLEEQTIFYQINRSCEQWASWPDWLEKVVWWGHRKGAYIYEDITREV